MANANAYTNEQITSAQQNGVEAFAELSEKAFAGFEKLVELNVAASKAVLSDSINHLQALISVKDAQALLALQASLVQPLAEKTASYSRHFYDIVSGTTADVSKTLESTSAESQKNATAFLESSLKNAPAGSDAAVAVFKSAIEAGNNVVETAQKAAKHTVQLVDSNINTAAKAANKA